MVYLLLHTIGSSAPICNDISVAIFMELIMQLNLLLRKLIYIKVSKDITLIFRPLNL